MKGARGFRAFAIASLLLAVVASTQGPTASAAATITVTTTADELNADGDCSLREAIQAANTDTAVDACTAGSGADTVNVASGTYTLAVSGANEDANATGDLDITAGVTITGAGSRSTIVTGPAGWDDRIFDVIPDSATVAISGLTVAGGNAFDGGGIRETGGLAPLDLTLSDVVLSGNTAAGQGGGLYSDTTGDLTLTNVTATGNTAVSNGGGIQAANASSTMTNLTLTDNRSTGSGFGGGLRVQDLITHITGLTATGNSTAGNPGGGLALVSGGGVLEDAIISGNHVGTTGAGSGGGVFAGSDWTIRRSSITQNQGGGVSAPGAAGSVLEDVTVDGNTNVDPSCPACGTVGGGISGSDFTLRRVAVTNNTATAWGGGINDQGGTGMHLVNVTISGNSGGGFATNVSGDPTTASNLLNVTIADNSPTAQSASGIQTFGGAVAVLENVIVEGPEPLVSSGIVDNGHNLYSETLAGIGLGPLASNDGPADDPPDGPTKTHALLPGSPAIDAGSSNCPTDDQRGFARTAICDIGAFEFVADLSITKSDSPDPATVGGNLTYTLTVANAGPDGASDVSVTDTLPASVTFVSATPSQGSCSQSAGTVTCSIGTVASAATSTVTIVVTPNSAGTITNSASVQPSTGDPDLTNNSDSEDTGVVVAGVDGALDVIVSGPTKSVASGGSRKVFVTNACNVGTVNITVNPADISTSRTVNRNPAGGTVTLLTNPTPMLLRPGACQRYRWEWSYGADGPANPGDTVVYQATWNLAGDGVPANNTDSETRTAT